MLNAVLPGGGGVATHGLVLFPWPSFGGGDGDTIREFLDGLPGLVARGAGYLGTAGKGPGLYAAAGPCLRGLNWKRSRIDQTTMAAFTRTVLEDSQQPDVITKLRRPGYYCALHVVAYPLPQWNNVAPLGKSIMEEKKEEQQRHRRSPPTNQHGGDSDESLLWTLLVYSMYGVAFCVAAVLIMGLAKNFKRSRGR